MTPITSMSGCECLQCGHRWIPEGPEKPKRCGKCKTPAWDRPKKKSGRPKVERPQLPLLAIPGDSAEEPAGLYEPALNIQSTPFGPVTLISGQAPQGDPRALKWLANELGKKATGDEPRKERGMQQIRSGARDVAPHPDPAEMPASPTLQPARCAHGRPVGFSCWQCKGVAKVEP